MVNEAYEGRRRGGLNVEDEGLFFAFGEVGFLYFGKALLGEDFEGLRALGEGEWWGVICGQDKVLRGGGAQESESGDRPIASSKGEGEEGFRWGRGRGRCGRGEGGEEEGVRGGVLGMLDGLCFCGIAWGMYFQGIAAIGEGLGLEAAVVEGLELLAEEVNLGVGDGFLSMPVSNGAEEGCGGGERGGGGGGGGGEGAGGGEGLGGEGDAAEEAPGGEGVKAGHMGGFELEFSAEEEGEAGEHGEFGAEAKGLGVSFFPGGVDVFFQPEGEGELVFDEGGSIRQGDFEGEADEPEVAFIEVPREGCPDIGAIGVIGGGLGELVEGGFGIAAYMEAEVGVEGEGEFGGELLQVPGEQGDRAEGEAQAAHGLVVRKHAQSQVDTGIEAGEEAVGEFQAEVSVSEHLSCGGGGYFGGAGFIVGSGGSDFIVGISFEPREEDPCCGEGSGPEVGVYIAAVIKGFGELIGMGIAEGQGEVEEARGTELGGVQMDEAHAVEEGNGAVIAFIADFQEEGAWGMAIGFRRWW